MATQKPWRTVLTGTSTGRFTRQQIRDAIESVSSKSKRGGTDSKAAGGESKTMKSAGGVKRASASSKTVPTKSGGAAPAKHDRPAKARDGTPE